jgi:hypothetical protein
MHAPLLLVEMRVQTIARSKPFIALQFIVVPGLGPLGRIGSIARSWNDRLRQGRPVFVRHLRKRARRFIVPAA